MCPAALLLLAALLLGELCVSDKRLYVKGKVVFDEKGSLDEEVREHIESAARSQ